MPSKELLELKKKLDKIISEQVEQEVEQEKIDPSLLSWYPILQSKGIVDPKELKLCAELCYNQSFVDKESNLDYDHIPSYLPWIIKTLKKTKSLNLIPIITSKNKSGLMTYMDYISTDSGRTMIKNTKMGLTVKTKNINLTEHKTTIKIPKTIPEEILNSKEDFVEDLVVDNFSNYLDTMITKKLFDLGEENKNNYLRSSDVTLDFNMKESINRYENPVGDIQSRILISKIMVASNIISQQARRGPATHILTNMVLGSILSTYSGFNSNEDLSSSMGIRCIGDVFGIKVYVDQIMKNSDNRILVTRNYGDQSDPGLKLVINSLISNIKKNKNNYNISSIYDFVELGSESEKYFYTINVDLGAI